MLTCPMCKNSIAPVSRQCPRCQTDVSLLCDFRDRVGQGVTRAESYLRAGSLDEAVWAYLEVLEVDPDNPTARRQVGKVVAAVRQFDRVSPGRRWYQRLQKQARFRRWIHGHDHDSVRGNWLVPALVAGLVVVAFTIGYLLGHGSSHADEGKETTGSDTQACSGGGIALHTPPHPLQCNTCNAMQRCNTLDTRSIRQLNRACPMRTWKRWGKPQRLGLETFRWSRFGRA